MNGRCICAATRGSRPSLLPGKGKLSWEHGCEFRAIPVTVKLTNAQGNHCGAACPARGKVRQ